MMMMMKGSVRYEHHRHRKYALNMGKHDRIIIVFLYMFVCMCLSVCLSVMFDNIYKVVVAKRMNDRLS